LQLGFKRIGRTPFFGLSMAQGMATVGGVAAAGEEVTHRDHSFRTVLYRFGSLVPPFHAT